MNAVRDLLKSGKTVIGTAGSPSVHTGMLADAGFDFLLFDTQHSPVETKQLYPAIFDDDRRNGKGWRRKRHW
jgi:2-keto-3-deoxy-L-rhamnonate aldolase RhmA